MLESKPPITIYHDDFALHQCANFFRYLKEEYIPTHEDIQLVNARNQVLSRYLSTTDVEVEPEVNADWSIAKTCIEGVKYFHTNESYSYLPRASLRLDWDTLTSSYLFSLLEENYLNYYPSMYIPLSYVVGVEDALYPRLRNRLKVASLLEARDNLLFIKSDSGDKSITGQIIQVGQSTKSIAEQLFSSAEYATMKHNPNYAAKVLSQLCLISTVEDIEVEVRFLVSTRGIEAASFYKPVEGVVLVEECSHINHSNFWGYADGILPNLEYALRANSGLLILDVAKLKYGGYRVVEINSFTFAGLYAMNPKDVIEAVKFNLTDLNDEF